MEVMKFEYGDTTVEFDFSVNNVMVNATQMAKIFPNKRMNDFLSNDDTKLFILECLKSGNSRYLNVEKEQDLVNSKQKSGTWMHRILALKFAAWLDPAFELWVYVTIDFIMFGHYREMEANFKESAKRRNRIAELTRKLQENEEYLELDLLQAEERRSGVVRGKKSREQITMFRDFFFSEDIKAAAVIPDASSD
jgi:hypothetical protein